MMGVWGGRCYGGGNKWVGVVVVLSVCVDVDVGSGCVGV